MAKKPLTMGIFASFSPPTWHGETDQMAEADWATGRFHERLAKRAEESAFDFIFFEDTVSVSRVGGSMAADLSSAISAPKNDPIALISYLAAVTNNIGLVSTASTSLYPPYLLARVLATIDSLSNGRAGWNIVTSSEKESAQNFGMDELPPTNERYGWADEFLDVVNALWDSWDEDAVILDVERNVHTDPTKVREINHVGERYKVRGPLNTLPSPQRRPVYFQAGGSDRGREFAARHAEVVMATSGGGIEGMKAYCSDVRGRMAKYGRDPSDIKFVFMINPIVCDDKDEYRRNVSEKSIKEAMLTHSAHFGVDLTQFDPNQPLPMDVVSNGTTSMVEMMKAEGQRGKSIRDVLIDLSLGSFGADPFGQFGRAEDIADNLIEAAEKIGLDGYIFSGFSRGLTKERYTNVFDKIIPELQKRGAMKTSYSGDTFRANLFG